MRRSLLILLLATSACTPEVEEIDEIAAASTAEAIDGNATVAQSSGWLAPPTTVGNQRVDLARVAAIDRIRTSLTGLVSEPGCLTIESDDATYVEATFVDCELGRLGLLRLDAHQRIDVDFDTMPCPIGPGECVTAADYVITTEAWTVRTARGALRHQLAGSWRLRVPFDEGPRTWDGELSVTGASGRTLSSATTAEWSASELCVTLTHLDSTAAVTEVDGTSLGTLAVTASDVVRCGDGCPEAGTVRVATPAGALLAWDYGGSDAVSVVGPRGARAEVPLSCAE